MSSRRDSVQAYAFTVRRLRMGMLHGDPDGLDPTSARTWRGTMIGIVIALLVAAGIAVFGLISPGGNDDWRQSGTLVVVSDTGARYLYLDSLHPVLNQTSARLIAGDKLRVETVESSEIGDTPQGAPVGLIGAPDSVPSAGDLNGGAWLACAVDTTTEQGTSSTRLAVRVDAPALGTGLTNRQAVWVKTPDGVQYLLWSGRRLRMDVGGGAAAALGYGTAVPVTVPVGFVDGVPAGSDLAAALPASLGTPGPALAGRATKVGQLFGGPSGQGYVLTASGLSPVSPVGLALLRGHPSVQRLAYGGAAPTVFVIGPGDVPAASTAGTTADLPSTPPALVSPPAGESLCGSTRSEAGTLVSTVSFAPTPSVLAGAEPAASQPGVAPGCEGADLVAVAPGSGALVSVLIGTGASASQYLVADNGVKYPLTNAGAASLGYAPSAAVSLPSALLRLLPTGPTLDPAALGSRGIVSPRASTTCR